MSLKSGQPCHYCEEKKQNHIKKNQRPRDIASVIGKPRIPPYGRKYADDEEK